MAYGMSYAEALGLVQERAIKDCCWAIKQLKKLLRNKG